MKTILVPIESIPAMQKLDEILSAGIVDSVLIGPHDLSCSLNIPEKYDHPEFDRACREIFAKARAKGVGAGVHAWMGLEQTAKWAEAGANFIVHESDMRTFAFHMGGDLPKLRKMLGDLS